LAHHAFAMAKGMDLLASEEGMNYHQHNADCFLSIK